MELNINWKESCEHCNGSGSCPNNNGKGCYEFCKNTTKIVWNKKKTKSKYEFVAGRCNCCDGKGFILTELGEKMMDFMNYYKDNFLISEIKDIADNRCYEYNNRE